MTIKAENADEYIAKSPGERQNALKKIREIFRENLPSGFEESMSCGMPGFVVPFSKYPDGYHCNPDEPLPFVSFASQKNHIALYHSGVYVIPEIKEWFEQEYKKITGKNPDMGKSCIRFSNPGKIPFNLLAELAGKVSVDEWIEKYEEGRKGKN